MFKKYNKKRKKSRMKDIIRSMMKNTPAVAGFFIIMAIIIAVILADLIVPYDIALKQNYSMLLQPPSAEYIFGTDSYGRDIFARIIHGGRNSLTLGVASMLISLFIGTLIGAACGYFGGILDNAVMRFLDTIKSIPSIMMALAIVAALGASLINLMLAITISSVPGFVRVIRSAVIGISGQEYLEAAKAAGTSNFRIIYKHIIPNCIGVIIVQATMSVSQMILYAASLSFIGMGIQPPAPEWGAMLSEARDYMRNAPHLMFFPGLFIVLSALSFNLIGDGLRDALDPRLKS